MHICSARLKFLDCVLFLNPLSGFYFQVLNASRLPSVVSHMVKVVQLNVWQLNVVARVFAALVAFYLVMLVAIYLLLFYLCC